MKTESKNLQTSRYRGSSKDSEISLA